MSKAASTNSKAAEFPFDLFGDLEDAYDRAEREGNVELAETLDAFGLWDGNAKCTLSWMHKAWRAVNGDVDAQTDLGHAFCWDEYDADAIREKYKWLDRPTLAIYWYTLAAEAGHAEAQNDLARIYCPNLKPYSACKIGRFSRRWREEAAAQKLPEAMRSLAHCLRCGKCCCCPRDLPRADALEAEAGAIEQRNKSNKKKPTTDNKKNKENKQ